MLTIISAVITGMLNGEKICNDEIGINDASLAWQVSGLTLILEVIVECVLLVRHFIKKFKK